MQSRCEQNKDEDSNDSGDELSVNLNEIANVMMSQDWKIKG